ncbi:MAG: UbiH/UbiF/VisC/COQ6 family ubiquinone biosynthesis hydroxylase [Pseudomonadota bacterium]
MTTDVLITGGGLVGSTLALALAQGGLNVTLIDALPKATRAKPGFDGRSYAMALATTRMLRALGLWDALAPNAQAMNAIKVSQGRTGQKPTGYFMHFDHAEIGPDPMGYMVEDRHARAALLDAETRTPNLTHLAGVSVLAQDVAPGAATVTLSTGETLTAPILIGCDGRSSGTAERAGIKRLVSDYGQTSLVCALNVGRPHDGIAHQLFLPEGPLAILPLTEQRVGVVWTERTRRAAEIAAMADDAYLAVLRPRFGDFLGDITLAGDRFTYPLSLSLAQSFTAERLALVGDAAHGIHPIAGQGLNAGMKDVAALAETLIFARRRGEDIGSAQVLDRYARWRRFDTATLALATDSFNRLFSNTSGPLRSLRNLGLGAVNAIPKLRAGFMREAAGLTGDLPRLLRGEGL